MHMEAVRTNVFACSNSVQCVQYLVPGTLYPYDIRFYVYVPGARYLVPGTVPLVMITPYCVQLILYVPGPLGVYIAAIQNYVENSNH